MDYLLIRTEGGRDILQESCRGIVQRYTDLAGATVAPPSAGSEVVGEASPEWALSDPEPEPVVNPTDRRITKLAFMVRFSDAEAIAIDLASQGATVQAAAMRRYQAKVNAAEWIDLDREDTRAGVQALEAVGLIAPGRAAEILDAPVADDERPA